MRALAIAAGYADASSYQRYEEEPPKGREDHLKPQIIERLIPALVGKGYPPITRDEVIALGTPILAELAMPMSNASSPIAVARVDDKIGIFGRAAGGNDGSFEMNGNPIEYIETPPYLRGVSDAYGVYVIGDSMEPRYFAGELVYVHPNRPYKKGAFVVVQIKPDNEGDAPRAFIKQYLRQTGDHLHLAQFNPSGEIKPIPLSKVLSVHRIVGASHE